MYQNNANELTLKEFKNIFNREYVKLCELAHKYVKDSDCSEDIVQNVFVKVWENKNHFKNKDNIEGYFYTSVRNKSIDFLKSKYAKNVKAYPVEDLEILQTEDYYLSEVITIKTADIIDRAIESLSNKCAKAIRLSIESYTNREIAEEMAISIHTVKEYKKKGYKDLRKKLAYLRVS